MGLAGIVAARRIRPDLLGRPPGSPAPQPSPTGRGRTEAGAGKCSLPGNRSRPVKDYSLSLGERVGVRGNRTPGCIAACEESEEDRFDQRMERCVVKCATAWAEAATVTCSFGTAVDLAEKLEREQRADRCVEEIEAHLRQRPAARARRAAWRHGLLEAVRRIAGDYLQGDADGLDQLFTPEALEATRQFIRQARAFAPSITDQDLFQALRNLWVTHSVQLFLRAPITLTPPLFAYSMLYPWTDNCLDDAQLDLAEKLAFGDWLTLRLSGVKTTPHSLHYKQVCELVGMIERFFPRAEFPEVYLSLQAIHQAQMQSLEQQDAGRSWDERTLLNLSIAKGGASVLTDACLVHGSLTDEEAEFTFAYGVVLQLMDDLQDFRQDLANRHMTIFTLHAEPGPLDEITAQLWAFTQNVIWRFNRFAWEQPVSLKTLIQDNFRLLLTQTVARNSTYYTPQFVRRLESSSPVRFCYLASQEKTLAERYSRLAATFRQSRRIESLMGLLD
jgi:hypothetical protein